VARPGTTGDGLPSAPPGQTAAPVGDHERPRADVRILHLAYEDPRRPGSGGGGIRTWELTTRLAEQHDITVVVAGYPGAAQREEGGARWVPLGSRRGLHRGTLSYFALLPRVVRRIPHDLVVEDFGAPFSTGMSPLYTRAPVIASVQWMFAREMTRKYRVPFHLVERAGLHLYDRFIAVSAWLQTELARVRPRAHIDLVSNGVDPPADLEPRSGRGYLLYLGRLDWANKGLDLLVEAFRTAAAASGQRLVVAGDGPDRARLERALRQAGLAGCTELAGRVGAAEKYELLAGADAVVLPTRYETFGMVAVEAAAAGAPVVAFDVGPLREVVGPVADGRLVAPFDAPALGRAAIAYAGRPAASAERALAVRARFSWDEIALQQQACYRAAVEQHRAARVPAA
jgi:glycogen(starch) synthase